VRGTGELDAVDRATVVVWRVSNVVGWGLAASATYLLPQLAFGWAAEALKGRISAVLAVPALVIYAATTLVVLPALIGRLVGERIYRWPGVTAMLAVVVPGLTVLVPANGDDPLGLFGVVGIGAFIAAVTARDRWEARPRALRSLVIAR
jgi:hypothetical protein